MATNNDWNIDPFKITREEYARACIITAAFESLHRYPPNPNTSPKEQGPDPYEKIDQKTAAKMIGVTTTYLRKLEAQGRITRIDEPGRTVYYRRKDVEKLKRELDR